jgi:hypothetical protein
VTAGPGGATRRRVLATSALAAAGAAVAGCTPGTHWPWAKPPRPAPDVGVLHDVIDAEYKMISRYTAVLSVYPGLAGAISPVLAEHRQHLAQLRARLIIPAGASAAEAAAAAPPRLRRPQLPAGHAAALGYLRSAERAAAGALVGRLASVPPSLAQLIASIGASEATHAALLARTGSRR